MKSYTTYFFRFFTLATVGMLGANAMGPARKAPACGPHAHYAAAGNLSLCLYEGIRLPIMGNPKPYCKHIDRGYLGFTWHMNRRNRHYHCPNGARFQRIGRHEGFCRFDDFKAPAGSVEYCQNLSKGFIGYEWGLSPAPAPTPTPTPTPVANVIPPVDLNAVPSCTQAAGSLPAPNLAPGTRRTDIPIKHIVIIMQENRSFDNWFGALAQNGYGSAIDGIAPGQGNLDGSGNLVAPFHQTAACFAEGSNDWVSAHQMSSNGANSDFLKVNGTNAFGYYDGSDLGFLYALANRFAVADRYFSSILGPTYPNRMFEQAATSFGHIHNDTPKTGNVPPQKTIFDVLNQYGISWKYYFDDVPMLMLFPDTLTGNPGHLDSGADFVSDARNGTLPEVTFLESPQATGTEFASYDHYVGNAIIEDRMRAVMEGNSWGDTVVFYTFDEGGGFYDHVGSPHACVPDSSQLLYQAGDVQEQLDRYGFRVPFLAVSPFVKQHYVSHVTYDHTSMLRFIETKFNLPALTRRDANADPMLDLFDFSSPNAAVPALPRTLVDPSVLANCLKTVNPAP